MSDVGTAWPGSASLRVRFALRGQNVHATDAATVLSAALSEPLACRVTCAGAPLMLTSTEFKLLCALATQPGVAMGREALSDAVQPGSYMPLDRAVDVQVGRLRKKLRAAPGGSDWIETVRGEGYVFTGRPSSPQP